MTKESHIKGPVFIPKCVKNNPDVQRAFRNTDMRTKHGSRKAIKLSELSPTLRTKVFNRPSQLAYTPFSKSI
jgi:phenolic acid decarboxylase